MMELPSMSDRLEIVSNLWKRTVPGGYLILVENGTNAGFQVIIIIARTFGICPCETDFLNCRPSLKPEISYCIWSRKPDLNVMYSARYAKVEIRPTNFMSIIYYHSLHFLQCPHEKICPRYALDSIPCNFIVPYKTLLPFSKEIIKLEKYSYVVIKKGKILWNLKQCERVLTRLTN